MTGESPFTGLDSYARRLLGAPGMTMTGETGSRRTIRAFWNGLRDRRESVSDFLAARFLEGVEAQMNADALALAAAPRPAGPSATVVASSITPQAQAGPVIEPGTYDRTFGTNAGARPGPLVVPEPGIAPFCPAPDAVTTAPGARSAIATSLPRVSTPAGPDPLSGDAGSARSAPPAAEGHDSPQAIPSPESIALPPAGTLATVTELRPAQVQQVSRKVEAYRRHSWLSEQFKSADGSLKTQGQFSIADNHYRLDIVAGRDREVSARQSGLLRRMDERDRLQAEDRLTYGKGKREIEQLTAERVRIQDMIAEQAAHGNCLVDELPAEVLERIGNARRAS